ncbi:MAG: amidase [Ruminococcaceae bacterium]|nr:amidase [Oscillospiraceae bacterium]
MRKKSPVLLLILCLSILLCTVAQAVELDDTARKQAYELAANNTPELSAEQKNALLSALYEADLDDICKAIELRLITCQELTAYYLKRIETYNEDYNCFITICEDAMDIAAQRDAEIEAGTADGALFGIPVVVKDNIHVAGYPTTNGYSKESVSVSDENAYVVERLLEEGAVIIAKSNMSTEAQDARASYSSAVGHTRNAYNTHLSPGGSSGGSAASTSLNFCAASLGTDTNSSLRMPAALNGCVALRVTTGLIPMDNIIKLNSSRDVVGSITRSVEDQAIMLSILTGGTYYDNLNADVLNGLRIGVLEELSYAVSYDSERSEESIDDEVASAFENAITELESCGAEVVKVSMSDFFYLSDRTFPAGGYEYIDDFTSEFEEFLAENNISAVIYPTYLSTPLRMGTDENGTYWDVYEQDFINNCRALAPSAAIPDITVPIGSHSLGAGIGMEIAAAPNSEQLLLDIAYSYTLSFNHRAVPTGAPDLYAAFNAGTLSEYIDSYLLSLLPVQEEETPQVGPKKEPLFIPEPVPEEEEEFELSTVNIIIISCVGIVFITAILRGIRNLKRRRRKKKNSHIEEDIRETVAK